MTFIIFSMISCLAATNEPAFDFGPYLENPVLSRRLSPEKFGEYLVHMRQHEKDVLQNDARDREESKLATLRIEAELANVALHQQQTKNHQTKINFGSDWLFLEMERLEKIKTGEIPAIAKYCLTLDNMERLERETQTNQELLAGSMTQNGEGRMCQIFRWFSRQTPEASNPSCEKRHKEIAELKQRKLDQIDAQILETESAYRTTLEQALALTRTVFSYRPTPMHIESRPIVEALDEDEGQVCDTMRLPHGTPQHPELRACLIRIQAIQHEQKKREADLNQKRSDLHRQQLEALDEEQASWTKMKQETEARFGRLLKNQEENLKKLKEIQEQLRCTHEQSQYKTAY